jgi:hypothetical protein
MILVHGRIRDAKLQVGSVEGRSSQQTSSKQDIRWTRGHLSTNLHSALCIISLESLGILATLREHLGLWG